MQNVLGGSIISLNWLQHKDQTTKAKLGSNGFIKKFDTLFKNYFQHFWCELANFQMILN